MAEIPDQENRIRCQRIWCNHYYYIVTMRLSHNREMGTSFFLLLNAVRTIVLRKEVSKITPPLLVLLCQLSKTQRYSAQCCCLKKNDQVNSV